MSIHSVLILYLMYYLNLCSTYLYIIVIIKQGFFTKYDTDENKFLNLFFKITIIKKSV